MEKDKVIKSEIRRLGKIFKDLDPQRKQTATNLIEEAAFMKATLMDLKTQINEFGPVDEMPQGDYSILREHPALKSYNTMVQRYFTSIKQLTDLLPKEKEKELDDGFDDFLKAR